MHECLNEFWRTPSGKSFRPTDERPGGRRFGQQEVVSFANDLVLAHGGEFAEAADPGHDFDFVTDKCGLQVLNVMSPHDEDRPGREVAFLGPALRGRVLDRRVLQPSQVLDIADVSLIVDLVRLNGMTQLKESGHGDDPDGK